MKILKKGRLQSVVICCRKCHGSFRFSKEDGVKYQTNYSDVKQGYVVLHCPTLNCKETFFPDLLDFK